MNKYLSLTRSLSFLAVFTLLLTVTDALFAQSIVGVINSAIGNMVTVLNVLIVGVIAWSGFLLARGDASGVQRIVYGIIGLIVVNSARVLIEFFI